MQRRKFLQNIAFLTGGLLFTRQLPASVLAAKGKKIKGTVRSKGNGIAGVVVSDGYSVVTTDKKGRYEFDANEASVAVFISTPARYAFAHENGIARQYRSTQHAGEKDFDFDLVPLDKNDEAHQFIIWADPQVKNEKDVEKMLSISVPDTKKLIEAAGPDALLHGITVGDLVWDEHKFFPDYDRAVKEMGIPFFQCLGNHDMDYNKGGDESSDDTFQELYGPTYYSFNRGQVHYVVMDNVRYLGKDRDYDGFFQQNQLDWLKQDLSFVPKNKLIVLCVHIPVHSSTKNKADLYDILGDRNVHIMSGHTHYHVNAITENIYEHNHGTVCGAWWTGPICVDGTPNGYGVYSVNGTDISWHYQATGMPADHQMKIFLKDFDAEKKMLTANIWNYDPEWKTEYWVDGVNGGPLEQFEGFDPLAYSTLLGPDLPKPRGFAEPRMTNHLFRAMIPVRAKEVKLVVTDRFGRKFTETHRLDA